MCLIIILDTTYTTAMIDKKKQVDKRGAHILDI